MLRLLIFLVGMLSTRRPEAVSPRPARDRDEPEEDAAWYLPPRPEPPRLPREARTMPLRPDHGTAAEPGIGPAVLHVDRVRHRVVHGDVVNRPRQLWLGQHDRDAHAAGHPARRAA